MSDRQLVVLVGCGAAKLDRRAPAGYLYTGQHFRLAYAAACTLSAAAVPGRVWILSALHGLVRPWEELDPYDLKLGQPGSVTAARIRGQAAADGLQGARAVALCGRAYADLAAAAWPDVERPLDGLGIGAQRHVLAQIRDRGLDALGAA